MNHLLLIAPNSLTRNKPTAFSTHDDDFTGTIEKANLSQCSCTIYVSGRILLQQDIQLFNHSLIGIRDDNAGFQSAQASQYTTRVFETYIDSLNTLVQPDLSHAQPTDGNPELLGLPVFYLPSDHNGKRLLELFGTASMQDIVMGSPSINIAIHQKHPVMMVISNLYWVFDRIVLYVPEKWIKKAMDHSDSTAASKTSNAAASDIGIFTFIKPARCSKPSSSSPGGAGGGEKPPDKPIEKDHDNGRDAVVRTYMMEALLAKLTTDLNELAKERREIDASLQATGQEAKEVARTLKSLATQSEPVRSARYTQAIYFPSGVGEPSFSQLLPISEEGESCYEDSATELSPAELSTTRGVDTKENSSPLNSVWEQLYEEACKD